jgi:hypothetical protein
MSRDVKIITAAAWLLDVVNIAVMPWGEPAYMVSWVHRRRNFVTRSSHVKHVGHSPRNPCSVVRKCQNVFLCIRWAILPMKYSGVLSSFAAAAITVVVHDAIILFPKEVRHLSVLLILSYWRGCWLVINRRSIFISALLPLWSVSKAG